MSANTDKDPSASSDGSDGNHPAARNGTNDDVAAVKRALPPLGEYVERHGKHTTSLDDTGRGANPVHGSSTGNNFDVDGDKWYCFSNGCECGGDILAWYAYDHGFVRSCKDASNLSRNPAAFYKTLVEAAKDAGVDIDAGNIDASAVAKREELADVYEDACGFYVENLTDEHREWLRESYGFSDDLIDSARIGYAPDGWESLLGYLRAEGYDDDLLIESALVVDGDYGLRDWTVDRIVFPYFDNGNVRHFIGRDPNFSPEGDSPKYMKMRSPKNHPEVSDEVYEPMFGVDSLRAAGDAEEVIVTEGVTDTLALHDHDVPAVAPVTTSFSKDAIREASRELRGHDVFVVMDEDPETEAGITGAVRTAKALAENGVWHVEVARIPTDDEDEAVDMADYLRDGGTITEVLDGSVGAFAASYRWGDGDPVDLYRHGCERIDWPPWKIRTWKDEDGNEHEEGLDDVIGEARDLAHAHRLFERHQTEMDGKERQELYSILIYEGLAVDGDWFLVDRGESTHLHYYDGEDATVLDVEGDRGSVSSEFRGLIQERFGILVSKWSRNLLTGVVDKARRNAPIRPLYTFAYYDESKPALYINAYDDRYYAVTSDGIEERRNGAEVFFSKPHDGEPYRYRDPSDRVDLPNPIPGERPMFAGGGDAVMRLIPNRVNYDEDANLGPIDQRNQLYLHLHILPFITALNSRPIMGWIGEKGSGKTVVQRSVGKWLFGPTFTESPMPDSADDLAVKLARKPLAFIDNYDDGEPWANDLLASVTTGSSIERRELFTTATLAQYKADCWVSVTSREPPFRRDDVADRTLVFRVQRLDTEGDEFVPAGVYYRQIDRYRDTLWSVYLDNLRDVLAELERTDLDQISTTHRMADWAAHAKIVAAALNVDGVENLLEAMQYEQSYFALEEDPVALCVERWISDDPDDAATWRRAGALLDRLKEKQEENNTPPLDVSSPGGLGKKLSSGLRSNFEALYGLEVKRPGRSNEYRFGDGSDDTTGTGLGRF